MSLSLDWKKFISVEILLFAIASAIGIMVAWSDVKSDIAVVQEKTEQNEKKYDEIDDKLDRIIDHLIGNNHDKSDG